MKTGIFLAVFCILALFLAGCSKPPGSAQVPSESPTISPSPAPSSTPACSAGWKCFDQSTRAYQDSKCQWVSQTECPRGCEDGVCKTAVSEFKQSEIVCEESEETGKKDQCYCSFDETRDKVSIVIKKGGVYDDQETIAKFEQYFDAVETHLGIESAGVKKFEGATKEELDQFIEGLVKQDLAGYIILVGMDLPIALKGDLPEIADQTLLDFPAIDDNYSYVGRTRESDSSCKDVAISVIVAPETPEIEKESQKADAYTDEKKRAFVSAVFSNFIDYHLNPEETFKTFNKGTLAIAWDASFLTSPETISEYRTIYFYKPVTLLINSDHNAIDTEIRKKPLLLIYATHGSIYDLGLGLDGEVFNSNQAVRSIYEENGQVSLFVESHIACNQHWIASGLFEFCCWPQTWLSAGAWAFFDVSGEPYHYNFERWL